MKDNFSKQSAVYQKHRPSYPPRLFDFILQHIPNKTTAWDCATGNGQTAKELALHFETVLATDISQKQLDHAFHADNILYSLQPAEQTDFAGHTIDLVTVSQALHWFDFDKFYTEVNRVGRRGAWLAAWMYSLLRISGEIDAAIEQYHFQTLAGYWDEERKHVDAHYTTVPFPFEEISTPVFTIEYYWTLQELEGYFNTWSALQQFISVNHYSPVPVLMATIAPMWKGKKMKITFPVYLRMGRIGS